MLTCQQNTWRVNQVFFKKFMWIIAIITRFYLKRAVEKTASQDINNELKFFFFFKEENILNGLNI